MIAGAAVAHLAGMWVWPQWLGSARRSVVRRADPAGSEQWLRLPAEIAGAERRTDVHAQREFERKRTKEIYKPAMALKYRDR